MATADRAIQFTLQYIQNKAVEILQLKPDPIPAYRLINEVLRMPEDEPEHKLTKANAMRSSQVEQLEKAQLPDGSWGRFHSQDSKQKTAFRTTEEAIDRAFALGLTAAHPILSRVRQYIEEVLKGRVNISDREEKNEAWPLIVKFIVAGRLAQIDPGNPLLDDAWEFLAEVARQAFATGEYHLEDETAAYLRMSGTQVPQGFLESQHAMWILSVRPLGTKLEHNLVQWLWNKPNGMRYLRAPLSEPNPRLIAYWLRSMNILSRFDAWREVAGNLLYRLWGQVEEHGLWDFGSKIARCTDFPLSDNWRRSQKRKVDYSTCMLALMRKYFD